VAVRYELRYRGQSFELGVEEDVRADMTGSSSATAPVGAPRPQSGGGPASGAIRGSFAPADDGPPPDPDVLREAFAEAHEQRYGYRDDGVGVELVTIRVSAWGTTPHLRLAATEGEPTPDAAREPTPAAAGEPTLGAAREPTPGAAIEGPTVCSLPGSTLYVPDGWRGTVDDYGTVHLHDEGAGE
jgi:hypothetical protein